MRGELRNALKAFGGGLVFLLLANHYFWEQMSFLQTAVETQIHIVENVNGGMVYEFTDETGEVRRVKVLSHSWYGATLGTRSVLVDPRELGVVVPPGFVSLWLSTVFFSILGVVSVIFAFHSLSVWRRDRKPE